MKIKFLGTAAYEGVPALFCDCEICKQSRAAGGRNLRTRAQAIINDDLLLDFGPDTFAHMVTYGLDFQKLQSCLITHNHSDHLYLSDLTVMRHRYADYALDKHFDFFGGASAYQALCECATLPRMDGALVPHLVQKGQMFSAGKYRVLPIPATHDPASSPFLYIIEDGEHSIFYANDTSRLSEEAYDILCAYGKAVDLIALDCTCGMQTVEKKAHLTLQMAHEVLARLYEIGTIAPHTKQVLHHFSHHARITHDDLVAHLAGENLIVAYDGMEIEL